MMVKWLKNNYVLSGHRLAPYALTYILAPVVLFLAFWLRPLIGIPLALLVTAAAVLAANPSFLEKVPLSGKLTHSERILQNPLLGVQRTGIKKEISIKGYLFIILLLVALTWCFFGGMGGFWAQSADWAARNAIFYDLIAKPWPLYYNDGANALIYYINHWLPVAAPMHGLYTFTGDLEFCITLGNILLLFWTALGVFLVELLLVCILEVTSLWQIALVVAMLLFFSGLDIVGLVLRAMNGNPEPAATAFSSMHLEWWAGSGAYQFSSNTTLLYWVFNQTVIPWIGVCIVLLARNLSAYVLVFVACYAAGPYASIGLVAIMLALALSSFRQCFKQGEAKTWLKSVFSFVNIIALFPVVLYTLYFMHNSSVATTGEKFEIFGLAPETSLVVLGLFFLLEVGVYLIILRKDYSKAPLFWAITATLLFAPLIHIGSMYEFCCRASIPALFVLMLMCTSFLLKRIQFSGKKLVKQSILTWVLLLCLSGSAMTPLFEVSRGFVEVRRIGIEATIQQPSDLEAAEVVSGRANNFKASVDKTSVFFQFIFGEGTGGG